MPCQDAATSTSPFRVARNHLNISWVWPFVFVCRSLCNHCQERADMLPLYDAITVDKRTQCGDVSHVLWWKHCTQSTTLKSSWSRGGPDSSTCPGSNNKVLKQRTSWWAILTQHDVPDDSWQTWERLPALIPTAWWHRKQGRRLCLRSGAGIQTVLTSSQ